MSAVTAHELIGPDQVGEGSVLMHDGTERGGLAFQVFSLIFHTAPVIGRSAMPLRPLLTRDSVLDSRVSVYLTVPRLPPWR